VADDDVVEHLDAEKLADAADALGDEFIVARGFGIAGGMVVGDDDR